MTTSRISAGTFHRSNCGGSWNARTPNTSRITNPIGSNSFSSAIEASTVELGTPLARDTNTTRAASPPLATRTLLRPAPATVARTARESDVMPIGRRKSHHRTPLISTERKFTPMAAARSGSDACRIEFHAWCQLIFVAK